MDVVYQTPIIGFIVIGVAALGLIFLLFLLILVFLPGRGQMFSRKTGGALALTVAMIILISGLWCVFLSPTVTSTEYRDSLYVDISIAGQSSWSYALDVLKGDTIDGSVSSFFEETVKDLRVSLINNTSQTFSLFVHDPDGEVVWSKINATHSYFTVRALKTGIYEIEVYNPNVETMYYYVSIYVQGKVILRPLEPLGQWLSLISLPIFGFGFWATGIYPATRKRR